MKITAFQIVADANILSVPLTLTSKLMNKLSCIVKKLYRLENCSQNCVRFSAGYDPGSALTENFGILRSDACRELQSLYQDVYRSCRAFLVH